MCRHTHIRIKHNACMSTPAVLVVWVIGSAFLSQTLHVVKWSFVTACVGRALIEKTLVDAAENYGVLI